MELVNLLRVFPPPCVDYSSTLLLKLFQRKSVQPLCLSLLSPLTLLRTFCLQIRRSLTAMWEENRGMGDDADWLWSLPQGGIQLSQNLIILSFCRVVCCGSTHKNTFYSINGGNNNVFRISTRKTPDKNFGFCIYFIPGTCTSDLNPIRLTCLISPWRVMKTPKVVTSRRKSPNVLTWSYSALLAKKVLSSVLWENNYFLFLFDKNVKTFYNLMCRVAQPASMHPWRGLAMTNRIDEDQEARCQSGCFQ